MVEVPKETLNCPKNNERLKSLEKEMTNVMGEVKGIKEDNSSQSELIAHIKTAIDFMIRDKEDQKEVNCKTLGALENINKTQVEMQIGLKRITEDVDDVKTRQEELEKKGKIDIVEILSSSVTKVLGGIVFGALALGVGYWVSSLG